jgi:hypothetical protein
MKKTLRHWAVTAVGAAAALAFTSCAYDPSYSSVGGSYSTGYGDGYGYGSSNFSTSVFVATGSPRWGYDPYRYSYYDYSRRSYYDPYLNGYYPVGYLPPIIYGVPHPYGYRRGYCPPPSYVRYNTVPNYRNREYAYRNSNYGWAKQVRQQPVTRGRVQDQHPGRQTANNGYRADSRTSNNGYSTDSRTATNQRNSSRENPGIRPSGGSSSRQTQGRTGSQQGVKPGVREQRGASLPQSYNTPVTRSSANKNPYAQGNSNARSQSRQPGQAAAQGGNRSAGRTNQPQPQAQPRKGNQGGGNQGGGNQRGDDGGRQEEKRGVRSLGRG